MIHALLIQAHARRVFLLIVMVLCAMGTAQAQFRASLQGSVRDANGAVVPGATIKLVSNENNKTQEVQSSDDGFYRISGLAPGVYSLTAEKQGFKKALLERVTVKGEETQGVDLTLTPGEVTESVTVAASIGEQLQTENANVSRALSTVEIRQLPQVGRDPYELVRLTPGVFGDGARGGNGNAINLPNTTGPGGSNNSIFQTENQVPISANGQRLSSNNFTILRMRVPALTVSRLFTGSSATTPV